MGMGYGFQLFEILAVLDLLVLGGGEEGGAEAADDSLSIAILNGKSGHLHCSYSVSQ